MLALDDSSRIGALRFRADADNHFLASGHGNIPPVIQLATLSNAAVAVHGESETAQDLRHLQLQRSHAEESRQTTSPQGPDARCVCLGLRVSIDGGSQADGVKIGEDLRAGHISNLPAPRLSLPRSSPSAAPLSVRWRPPKGRRF